MRFKDSKYVKSIVSYKEALTDKESILLIGRSNVGKSSFINTLTNRKNLARVSSTPGKTTTLNYFLVDDFLYLVDAPGYGYARRSKKDKESFLMMIGNFLKNISLKFIFLLIDFKVGPTASDLIVFKELKEFKNRIIIIFTKKDQIKRSLFAQTLKANLKLLNITTDFYLTSSSDGTGFDEIYEVLKNKGEIDE